MGVELLSKCLFHRWSSEKCGVYAVYGIDVYGNRVLIYVGQSENITERFKKPSQEGLF